MSDRSIFRLCKVSELEPGSARQVEVPAAPEPLALFNMDGELFLIDDTCTHGMAPLSLGFMENGLVYCPLHGGAFELATGRAVVTPCVTDVKTYHVWREGDDIVTDLTPRPPAGG